MMRKIWLLLIGIIINVSSLTITFGADKDYIKNVREECDYIWVQTKDGKFWELRGRDKVKKLEEIKRGHKIEFICDVFKTHDGGSYVFYEQSNNPFTKPPRDIKQFRINPKKWTDEIRRSKVRSIYIDGKKTTVFETEYEDGRVSRVPFCGFKATIVEPEKEEETEKMNKDKL
jgi:transcription antitermination factor NusG